MAKSVWGGSYIDISDVAPKGEQEPKRRYIPSKAKIRQWAKDSKEGGRFQCPACKESFSTTYARFGSTKQFESPRFYCKDCSAPNSEFRKADR